MLGYSPAVGLEAGLRETATQFKQVSGSTDFSEQ
jgi:hypothetical protein